MSDVISSGSDRDPWRPSRRLSAIAIAVVVLLAAGAATGREVQQRRHDRAAERQAVRQVALEVVEPSGGEPGWRLSNLSRTSLTITSARWDLPHHELLRSASRLEPLGSVLLDRSRAGCDEQLYDRGPAVLIVRAVTDKGSSLIRRLPLGADLHEAVWRELKEDCRLQSPGSALVGEIVEATWAGSTVRLTYGVNNIGALPLVLDGVRYEPGVTVAVLPTSLTLPASPTQGWGPTRRLVVQLRVSSCRRLEAALRAAEGGNGVDGWGTLKVQLHHARGRGGGYLDLGDHNVRLGRTCPSVARYLDGLPRP